MLTNGRSNLVDACIGREVTACLLLNEPTSYSYDARLSLSRDAAVAKASLNRALKYRAVYAKPGDLPMTRMK
jgi:hypothetical protein